MSTAPKLKGRVDRFACMVDDCFSCVRERWKPQHCKPYAIPENKWIWLTYKDWWGDDLLLNSLQLLIKHFDVSNQLLEPVSLLSLLLPGLHYQRFCISTPKPCRVKALKCSHLDPATSMFIQEKPSSQPGPCQTPIPGEHPGESCTPPASLNRDTDSQAYSPLSPDVRTYFLLAPDTHILDFTTMKDALLLTYGDSAAKLHPDLRGWIGGDRFRSFYTLTWRWL